MRLGISSLGRLGSLGVAGSAPTVAPPGGAWDPSALFAASEVGAWYDPSDLDTMFTLDNTGSASLLVANPVTAVESIVGVILDKSQGLTLGTDVTNGGFDTDTDWTYGVGCTIADGVWTSDNTDTLKQLSPETLAVGDWLVYEFDMTRPTAGYVYPLVCGALNASYKFGENGHCKWIVPVTTVTDQFIGLGTGSSATGITIDNLSIRKIAGNHAHQVTAASRPVLRARHNLLTYSEEFDNAYWTKARGTITATTETAPDGTATADIFTQSAGQTTLPLVYRSNTIANSPASAAYTFSIYVKAGTKTFFAIATDATTTPGSNVYSYFNLSTGAVASAGAGHTCAIESVGAGWYRLSLACTTRASVGNATWYFGGCDTTSTTVADDQGTVYLWGAQLNHGSTALPYQRIAAATDYVTSSTMETHDFPYYLEFDGVDDTFVTTAIDFSGGDEVTLAIGATMTGSGGSFGGLAMNFGAGGEFAMQAGASTANRFAFGMSGSAFVYATSTDTSAPPKTAILTGLGKISTDVTRLRQNGDAYDVTDATDLGTGNLKNDIITIGGYGGTGFPLNGRIYQYVVRGLLTSGDDLTALESYMAGKTGVTLA